MRLAALALLAGCSFGDRHFPPHRRPNLVPPEPQLAIGMTDLRTTLGRAGITVEARGAMTMVHSGCATEEGCKRCDLAAEGDELSPRTLEAVTKAFQVYPTYVLVAAHIERVALCRTIEDFDDGRRPGGVASAEDHRVMISFEYDTGESHHEERAGHTLDEVVHHELFHLLDWETNQDDFVDDAAWSALNPADFEYGKTLRADDQPGFVDGYAMTNPVEDRASVFQFLMSKPLETCERAERDPILAAKIQLLASRLAKHIDITFLSSQAPCAIAVPESERRRSIADPLWRRVPPSTKWLREPE